MTAADTPVVEGVEEMKVGEKRPLDTEKEVKQEEVPAAAPVAEVEKKEEKKETDEPEAKKVKVEEKVEKAPEAATATKSEEAPKMTADRLAVIKKQMEYYFCDDNLKFDRFFHKIISQNEEGYIAIEHFLNCKKLIALNCTEAEIIEACNASAEIEVKEKELRRKDNKALPTLEERKNKKDKKGKGAQQSVEDVQLFAAINFEKEDGKGVHIALKNGLAKAIEEKFGKPKKDTLHVAWTFKKGMIEDLPNAICLIFGGTPENDEQKEQVLNMSFSAELLVGKDSTKETMEFKCTPVTEKATRSKMWEATPVFLQKKKQAVHKQQSKQVQPPQFTVEGMPKKFTSQKLRIHVKDILNSRSLGEPIASDSKDYKFISVLLKHHPNQKKFEKMTGLKVDAWSESDDKHRCFYIIKEDGTTDNVSLMKCIVELEKSQMAEEEAKPAAEAKKEEVKKEEVKKEEGKPVEEAKKEEVKPAVEAKKEEDKPAVEAKKEEDKPAVEAKKEEAPKEEPKKEEAPKAE